MSCDNEMKSPFSASRQLFHPRGSKSRGCVVLCILWPKIFLRIFIVSTSSFQIDFSMHRTELCRVKCIQSDDCGRLILGLLISD